MTEGISANSVAAPGTAFRVEHRDGCTLVFGEVPVNDFHALTQAAPAGSQLSVPLARLAHSTIAFGPKENVDRLVCELQEVRLRGSTPDDAVLCETAQRWIKIGEQGLSSATMFWAITGVKTADIVNVQIPNDHPCDVYDFRRCRLLLEQVPEFVPLLPRLRAVSLVWDRLVGAWNELCAVMDAELPSWRDGCGLAELTQERLEEVIGTA